MKKALSFTLAAALLASVIAGCGNTNKTESTGTQTTTTAQAKKDVTVKVLNLKVEIADTLKKMEADYEKENPGVKLKFETVGGGADYDAALMAKFQSGDAPDVFVNGGYAQLHKWQDKLEDLSDQPWVKNIVPGFGDPMTKDGKLYGQPQALEGFGFAYNKTLFAKAGITEIPKTYTQLEDACKKLQAAGITPFINSYAEFWVLGCHNINLLLSQQPNPQKFIDDIAAGKVKIKDNAVTAGWIKLLDLTVKYGQKNMTTAGDYATSVNGFIAGKGAMIQQGNWIQPDIDKVNKDFDVGFIPMPTSDKPEEKLYAGIPNFWCVYNDSKAKDDAKAWLNWMVSSDTGKRYITDELKFIPAFTTIESKGFRGLNASLAEYAKAGKLYTWSFPRLPNGAINEIGATMMKYLGAQIDSTKMLEEIEKTIIDKANASK